MMARNRKEKNKGLPEGVYAEYGKYRTRYSSDGKRISTGAYHTPEEAEYMAHVKRYGHHWVGMEREDNFGFIYLMTNRKTGKKYIGKKQFYFWDGPIGGYKCSDLDSPWFDKEAWRESDWVRYHGSQKDIGRELVEGNPWDFTYNVVQMCRDKLDLHLSEVMHQIENDVLEATGDDGEYLYYNKNIAGEVFRPPFKRDNLLSVREQDEQAMRNYYLKPQLDRNGNVIPYGKSLETGGFIDVR